MPLPRILLLQHVETSPPGTLGPFLESRRANVHHVRMWKGVRVPQSVAPFDGVVVLGAPWAAWEDADHPTNAQVVALLQDSIKYDVPTLAICLGAQLLARAAGARNFRVAKPEIGWYRMSLTHAAGSDPLMRGLPAKFPVFLWHFDGHDTPPGATPLAHTERFPLQAFRVGGQQWGLLFHPDKTGAIIEGQLARHREMLRSMGPEFNPDDIMAQTRQLAVDQTRRAHRLFGNFVDMCTG